MINKVFDKINMVNDSDEKQRLIRRFTNYIHVAGFFVGSRMININEVVIYKMAEEYVFGNFGNVRVFFETKGYVFSF